MATDSGAPPAYPDLADGAPPAYAPSYDGGSAPQATPQYAQVQMPITQQLSQAQPAAGQQVVYMMQQPDGSLVPVQAMPQQQGIQYQQQQQIMYQQPQPQVQGTTFISNNGVTSVTPGTSYVSNVSQYGNGEPGTTTAVITTQNVRFKPREPETFNRKLVSWVLLIVMLIYIPHVYSTFSDILTYVDYGSSGYGSITIYYKHDSEYIYYTGFYGSSGTTDYDDACDDGNDDACDFESDGSAFWSLHWISIVTGTIATILLCNVVGKCCQCCGSPQRMLNGTKVCLIISSLSSLIALCIWAGGSHSTLCDDYYSDANDCSWGFTMIMSIIAVIGYLFSLILLFCGGNKPN